jgi:Ca2+-binding RTX toxin-like protein
VQNTGGGGFDQLIEIEYLIGSAFDDRLRGTGTNNIILVGGAGTDVLYSGPSDDYLIGGAGFDFVSFADATSGVTVDLSLGILQSTGGAGTDQFVDIEYVIGSSYGDIIKGDNVNNVLLAGGAGNDVIYSGAGSDYLIGGAGNDVVSFAGATSGVIVDLSISGVQNTGGAGFDQFVEIEYLVGSAYGDVLKGDGVSNAILHGGAGNDVLYSGSGNDYLIGGAGYDVVSFAAATSGVTVDLSIAGPQNTVGAGSDQFVDIEYMIGSAYGDTLKSDGVSNAILSGGGGNDTLQGGAGSDYVLGGDGADTLTGSAGADTLAGGAGADVFVFSNLSHITSGPSRDTIVDFSAAQGDKIDLSGIDADTITGGNQAFTFIGNVAFGNVAGQLRYLANGSGGVNVEGDIDGNGAADFSFIIDNIFNLTATDFIL